MEVFIKPTKDAEILANLNKIAQDRHSELHPAYFKKFEQGPIQKAFELLLAKDMFKAIAAFIDEKPAGYALYYFKEVRDNPFRPGYKSLWVDQIAVDEQVQGHGVGSKLLKALEKIAAKGGADRMELTYWHGNKGVGEFYEKHGYKENMHFAAKKIEPHQ